MEKYNFRFLVELRLIFATEIISVNRLTKNVRLFNYYLRYYDRMLSRRPIRNHASNHLTKMCTLKYITKYQNDFRKMCIMSVHIIHNKMMNASFSMYSSTNIVLTCLSNSEIIRNCGYFILALMC